MDEGIQIPIELDDSKGLAELANFGKNAERAAGEVSTLSGTIVKLKSSTVELVSSLRTSFEPEIYKAFVGGSRNVIVMQEALQTLKEDMRYATDPAQIIKYNIAIKDLSANIKSLNAAGTGGGNIFKSIGLQGGGALGGVINQVRQLAYILPGIGIAGIFGAAFSGIELLVKNIFGLGDAAEKVSPKIKELAGHVVEEASKLTLLTGIIQNTNSSYKDKHNALQAINQEYSTYLKNLGIEKVTIDNLKDSYDKIVESMLRQAVVKGLQDEISKAVEKTATELVKLEVEEEKRRLASEAASKALQQQSNVHKTLADSIKILNKPIVDGYIAQIKSNTATDAAVKSYFSYDERVKRLKESLIATLAPLLNVTKSFSDLDIKLNDPKTPVKVKTGKVDFDADTFGRELKKSIVDFRTGSEKKFEIPIKADVKIEPGTSLEEASKEFVDRINNSFKNIQIQGITSIGEAIGTALAGGDLKKVFSNFGNILATGLQEIGKELIVVSGLGKLAKEALRNLFTNPALAATVGVGLIALGAAIKSSIGNGIKGFAAGGLVSGPLLGLIGEGVGTSKSNPEVIAPLNQLKSFFADMIGARGGGLNAGGGIQSPVISINIPNEIIVKQQGRDLVGVIALEAKSQLRAGA